MQYGFCLSFVPHTAGDWNDGKGYLRLKQLCLPQNIKKMDYEYTLRCGDHFVTTRNDHYLDMLEKITMPLIEAQFVVTIVIKKIFDFDDNEISENDWFKYGIIV